jgi:hypothetical protein
VEAGWHVADDRYAVVLQVERIRRNDREGDDDDHTRELRCEAREREQRDQTGDPDGHGGPLPLPDVVDRLREHLERVAGRLCDAHDLRHLADGDVEAEPDDEALEHGPREEAGDEPHPRQPAGDVDHADHQRERNGQRDVIGRARARRRHQGDRGG